MKKIVSIIMIVLAMIIVITAVLNKDYADKRTAMESRAEFIMMKNGTVVDTLDLNLIKKASAEDFTAVLKTNGKEPVEQNYSGTQLKNILNLYKIAADSIKLITVTSIDGFSVVYSAEEINTDKNVFLTFAREKELLKGRKEGGRGPFQIIVANDQFSNRRCKYAVEMDIR